MTDIKTNNRFSDIKFYIPLALVGHVANGKTTLVQKLTGVNTKRNSKEIQSGRTIKLGYANCIIWKCPVCDRITSSGQSQKKMTCCNYPSNKIQHISFLDAPGHHSFVQNMIKGSSIIDGAIVVTDVRKEALQVQTLEHLAILEILGVRNIIVVQNKIDLVNSEVCLKHYDMLKKELQGTVAEGAPIIPISAQQGIGIEYVQKYLYLMVQNLSKHISPSNQNIFSIVRSFDVNKPGTEIDNLKGGVIGGTTNGQGYNIGDIIEIRPGLVSSEVGGKYLPLKTQIRTIFSESDQCTSLVRGGLYGLGTKLDPTLTKDDRLVGCVAGFPEYLPPVIDVLKMTIYKMKEAESIDVDKSYTLIIGSTVVKGNCTEKTKKKVIMKLVKPICAIENKCIIYSSDTKLVGFGVFGEENKERIVGDKINQTFEEYKRLLPDFKEEEKIKYSIPIPQMCKENKNIIWSNMQVFCQTIHRDQTHISTYIQQELCASVSVCDLGLRIYKMRLDANKFQGVLRKYIVDRICCSECRGVDTEIRKQKGFNEVFCNKCGSSRNELHK